MPSQSHIAPVLLGDPKPCRQVTDCLLDDYGVQPINHPTVPHGTERLRLTPSPLHEDVDMDRLIAALQAIWVPLRFQPTA